MLHETQVEVRANERLAPSIFLLTVDDLDGPAGGAMAAAAEPGQFVMIEACPGPEPLLRRPMSFCQVGPSQQPASAAGEFSILYQVIGAGTRLMSQLAPGDRVACLGPLGRGFRVPARRDRPVVMVAGGIGVAPFPFLAERLRRDRIETRLLYGARHAGLLTGLEWFRALGIDPAVATDDGSAGRHGLVTALLEETIATEGTAVTVMACGPDPMLRAVADLCAARGVACQLSLEAVMPCGFGVCLGCCVTDARATGTYLRICTDGPVFGREEIVL